MDLLFYGEKIILPDNVGYSEKTGTSYSAGAVSGIIGEFISIYPDINPEHIVYTLYDTAISVDGKGTCLLYTSKSIILYRPRSVKYQN